MTTMRESSRNVWTSKGTIEHINTGSLQRIADAVEKMATNHLELMRERDKFERWYRNTVAERDAALRSNAALRGVITKLKRAKP